MAKTTSKRKRSTKRVRRKPLKTPALSAVEKKITALEENLEHVKEVTTAVLEEEIERSKKIAVEVREHLHRAARNGMPTKKS